jgi:hypothetical protein
MNWQAMTFAAVDLDAKPVDDPERVAAHLKIVPARLHDLDRPLLRNGGVNTVGCGQAAIS